MSESGVPLNKGHICMAKTSPVGVHEAYLDLFERYFTLFLTSRSEEILSGGHVLLSIIGNDRKPGDPRCTGWELLGVTLNDMVLEVNDSLPLFDVHH